MNQLRVASVQFEHIAGNKVANLKKIRAFTERAAENQAHLIVFPEMCITGYWHVRKLSKAETESLAEPVPEGPSSLELLSISRQYNITLGAGLIEHGDDGAFYNTWILAMPDGKVVSHRKLHCFINEFMSSGNTYTVTEIPQGAKVGILICYDNNIIENVRATALLGAEILLSPHQTGGCLSRSPKAMGLIDPELWWNRENDPKAIEAEIRGPKGRGWLMRWLPSRAHDNGTFLVFSNGIGYDDGEIRTGNAMILDPYGEILAETWKAGDDMVIADLDPALLPLSTGQRWITARRPELYASLVQPTGREVNTRKVRFGQ